MKRGLRFHWLALCVVIAVCAAAAATAAAAGGGAGAARERARELRLQEAETQLRVAEEALHVAERRAEAGVGLTDDVRERQLDVVRAARALAELRAMQAERVSLDVKDMPLHVALTRLFEGTGQSLVLDPAISESPRAVTLRFNDVPLESAVKVICKLYNLDYETDGEGLWVIVPSSSFVTVGGARVPIVGTVTSIPGTQGGDTTLALQGIRVSEGGGRRLREARNRPSFPGDDRLVDLDVKDAPLSEVASRLSLRADPQAHPPSGRAHDLEITADDAVKDLKVTAKIAKWPLGEVLDMLLAQTGLVCTVDASDGERGRVTAVRVYLVPAPEMRVSGEGLPSEALVGRYMTIGGAGKQWFDAASALQALRQCPQCHATILLPGWKFCPYCGAEAVGEEEQPEGAG